MNALATKPRAGKKAQPQQTQFAKHLADARALWREADVLLTEVWDKSEVGEPIELMLGHIVEHLTPDAVRAPLMKEAPTSADIERIHQGLFTPIACLSGAVALASGTILAAPLERVRSILDELQNQCDSVMPLASMASTKEEQAATPAAVSTEHFDTDDHPVTCAWYRIGEAHAVIKSREEDVRPGDNLVPAVARVVSMAEAILGGLHSSHGDPVVDEHALDEASCILTEACALLAVINDTSTDDAALRGAETLLHLASSLIDDVQRALRAKERAK